MAKLKEKETPKLNDEKAYFLNVASLSLLHLAFTVLKNYKPLFEILQKYDSFDAFMQDVKDKTIKDLGL